VTSNTAPATADKNGGKPLRRDAAHNRDLLLAAAGEVFDAHGLDASVAEVARVAGVGMGTLYRRFPTKEALIDALVRELLNATITMARDAAGEPAGTGLEQFLQKSGAYWAQHPGCLPRLWRTDDDLVDIARELIAALLADAKKHGRVRHDLTSTDLTMAMWATRGVQETTHGFAPDAWRRHLDLLIAGMRPSDVDLPHRAVRQSELDAALNH
jgi:AcrR family transcriptional regulator